MNDIDTLTEEQLDGQTMSFDLFMVQWDTKWLREYAKISGYRRGQALVNCVGTYRPELVRSIPIEVDPYDCDRHVESFLKWLKENW